MKKSKIFISIGAVLLVATAVFAKRVNKRDPVPNTLYWNNGSVPYHAFSPGCLATLFTTTNTSYPASMNNYGIFWYTFFGPTGVYLHVYLKQPL